MVSTIVTGVTGAITGLVTSISTVIPTAFNNVFFVEGELSAAGAFCCLSLGLALIGGIIGMVRSRV